MNGESQTVQVLFFLQRSKRNIQPDSYLLVANDLESDKSKDIYLSYFSPDELRDVDRMSATYEFRAYPETE